MNDKATDKQDDALDRAIAALPRERLPERDLWPELALRLPARQPAWKRAAPWAVAAAIAIVASGLWFNQVPTSVPVAERTPPVQSPAQPRVTNDPEAELLSTYERQKGAQLAALPANSPAVERQLAIWDGAIAQVRLALNFYPEEPQLLAQLNKLYQQQLAYLERVAMTDPQLVAYY